MCRVMKFCISQKSKQLLFDTDDIQKSLTHNIIVITHFTILQSILSRNADGEKQKEKERQIERKNVNDFLMFFTICTATELAVACKTT